MCDSERPYELEYIGNIRFEFFTNLGSLTVEAWKNTMACTVTTFTKGLRRRTELELSDSVWIELVTPIAYSGFWKWEKRYDSHRQSGYVPSWSFMVLTVKGWFYSSGDGEYPDGLLEMLKGMMVFASRVEAIPCENAEKFLQPFVEGGRA